MLRGRVDWVVAGYVRQVLPPVTPPVDPPPVDPASDASQVWASAERCEAVVLAGRRMTGTRPNAVRVATWNIRWFPDGDLQPSPTSPPPTDLRWLACTLAWMNVDLVALHEIRTTPQAIAAWESVMNGISGSRAEALGTSSSKAAGPRGTSTSGSSGTWGASPCPT
jgi:hypothetical protein